MARALDDDAAHDAAAQGGGAPAGADPVAAPHPAPPHHAAHGSDRHVCPFCGSLNESPVGPCPKCTMENTPATRKATKARIGPWYVLQQRNPAAPGMRWDTLLAFVRKGRIKPRSVVRGPSTHQLWRYAMAVRGLSREFGLCYSCGGMIDKSAAVCPRCNRSQEPPVNPDALLETGDDGQAKARAAGASAAVYRELSSTSSPAGDDLDIVVPALGGLPAAGVVGADVFADYSPPDGPVTAAAAPVDAQKPPQKQPAAQPAKAPGGAAEKPNSEPAEALDVNDLAAAFKLQGTAGGLGPAYPVAGSGTGGWGGNTGGGGGGQGGGGGDFAFNPFGGGRTPDVPAVLINDLPPFYPRRRSMKAPILTLLFVGLLGVALWLTLDDLARRRTFAWFEDAYAALRRTGGDKTVATQRKTPPSGDGSSSKAVRPKTNPRPPGESLMALPPPPPPATNESPAAATQVAVSPSAATAPATSPTTAAVASAADTPEFPFTSPTDVPPTPDPTPPAPPPPPAPDLDELTQQARSLFNQGLTAEGNRDYREALRLYEQVKSKFPREAWPGGLEVRLGLARSQVK